MPAAPAATTTASSAGSRAKGCTTVTRSPAATPNNSGRGLNRIQRPIRAPEMAELPGSPRQFPGLGIVVTQADQSRGSSE